MSALRSAGRRLRALFVLVAGAVCSAGFAQAGLEEARQKAQSEIGQLEKHWRSDRQSLTFRDLDAVSPTLWASGDHELILRLQKIRVSMALRDGDIPREIDARLLAMMLTFAQEDPVGDNAAWESHALGQAYLKNADQVRDTGHYALYNALGICEALIRTGRRGLETVTICGQAHAMLGQSLLLDERPRRAMYHILKAQSLAGAAGFSQANRNGVDNLLKFARVAVGKMEPPGEASLCAKGSFKDEALRKGCLDHVDMLWMQGDFVKVESLLAEFASGLKCSATSDDVMEVVRSLHFARLLAYGPDAPQLAFTVCALSGSHNARGEAAPAAIVLWPFASAQMRQGVFEQVTLDALAHTARRFMRDNNELNSWLALDATMRYLASIENATDAPNDIVRHRREYMGPVIAYDMAYLAERNNWPDLRAAYLAIGQAAVDRSNANEIDMIYKRLALFFNEDYGFKAPTPVAAMEFFARIARKLPADDEYHKLVVVTWPTLESMYRNDHGRHARVAADNLDYYRRLQNADPLRIALLLQSYAEGLVVTTPDKARAARIEALDVLGVIPGQEGARITLLLELEVDRRSLGDAAGAERYFEQAVALRRNTPGLQARIASGVDMRLAVRAFNSGDRSGAMKLAETAFARVKASPGPEGEWALYPHARSFAQIVAINGDIKRARELYEEHVFPVTDNAVAAGDSLAIETRLGLAMLEALYGPTPQTIRNVQHLVTLTQRRTTNGNNLLGQAWRALAIANLGLGDGGAALDAARRSFALKPATVSLVEDDAADRRLSETFVAAAWSVAAGRQSLGEGR